MKSIPLTLPLATACALLCTTTLTPAALGQTRGAGPSTTDVSPSATARGQDQDMPNRRRSRNEDECFGSARDSASHSCAAEEDDQDGNRHRGMMGAHHRGDDGYGARLHWKRGDTEIKIRCPAREKITACVDAVGKLMDHVQSLGTSATTTRP